MRGSIAFDARTTLSQPTLSTMMMMTIIAGSLHLQDWYHPPHPLPPIPRNTPGPTPLCTVNPHTPMTMGATQDLASGAIYKYGEGRNVQQLER